MVMWSFPADGIAIRPLMPSPHGNAEDNELSGAKAAFPALDGWHHHVERRERPSLRDVEFGPCRSVSDWLQTPWRHDADLPLNVGLKARVPNRGDRKAPEYCTLRLVLKQTKAQAQAAELNCGCAYHS